MRRGKTPPSAVLIIPPKLTPPCAPRPAKQNRLFPVTEMAGRGQGSLDNCSGSHSKLEAELRPPYPNDLGSPCPCSPGPTSAHQPGSLSAAAGAAMGSPLVEGVVCKMTPMVLTPGSCPPGIPSHTVSLGEMVTLSFLMFSLTCSGKAAIML